MIKTVHITPAIICVSSLSLGCSNREIDLGGGRITSDLRASSRCAESTRVEGNVQVENQGQLEALAGCEEITGDLRIQIFEGADLAPLASLRTVGAALELGAQPLVAPEDPDEAEALSERIAAIQAAGYLPSLQGLASLESVPVVYLTGSAAASLTELSSLVDVDAVVIRDTPNLKNLAGLEAVTLSSIWISNVAALESLAGLVLETSVDTVILEHLPALRDAEALAGLQYASSSLMFYDTGLEALPAFGDLQYAGTLNVELNPALTDIGGIAGLGSVDALTISGNASLRSLPAFSQLRALDVLRVVNNDALEELALDFPSLLPASDSIDERSIELSASLVEVGMNDALRRIGPPSSFTAVQYFSVYQNAALTDVSLDQLRRVDSLRVEQNPSLVSFSAPSLATADSLEVLDNPALSPAVFDEVLTFEREIRGNAEPASP